jgi:PKD repeat protein
LSDSVASFRPLCVSNSSLEPEWTTSDSDDDTAEGTVTISIAGVNDAPTGITLSSTSVAQSGGTDAVVGTLSATDSDDSSHTFSLVSGSGDGDNAEFTIDDGDLRADDASALAEGDYDVRIEAGDGSGGTYEKQFIVTVTDDIVPTIASSTPADDATGVHEGDDITLTFSEDIAFGSGSITLRENDGGFSDWETFDASSDTGGGDGTVAVSGRTLTIDSESDLHSDTEYAVRVDAGTLTDTAESSNDFGGITDDTTLSFTTTDSIPPTASVGPDTTVDEDISVSFDGSGSTDNVNVDGYEWDWTGNGNYEGSGQTASHTYADPGTYTVTLRVTDGYGNTDTAQRAVTVADTGGGGGGYYDNTDPTARTQPNVTIDAGTTLDFDGSNSMDNDELDSYRWDFDGDGNYEESGVTVSRNYTASGVYTVTLRVTDDYGNTDTTERVVTVVDATPPTAVTQPNVTVEAGTAVTFDAANSTDNENITSYEWDFAGDGTYDASGITANHSYVDHGTYNATLRVTDGENNTDTAQRTVTVQARNGSGENTSSDAGSGEDGDDDSSDEGTANGDQGTESGTVDSGDDQVATATAPTTAAPTVNTESVETADSETTQQETTTGGSGPLSPMLAVVSIVLALFVYRQ